MYLLAWQHGGPWKLYPEQTLLCKEARLQLTKELSLFSIVE